MNISFYAPEQPLAPVFKAMPRVGATPPEVFSPMLQVWSAGFGGSSLLRADPASGDPNTRTTAYGGVIGLNYLLAPTTLIGISVEQSQSNSSSSDPVQSTSSRQDGTTVALSWIQLFGSYSVVGNVGYTRFNNTTNAVITDLETINASYASNQFNVGLEVGRPFAISKLSITPFVGVQLTKLWYPTYTETSIDLSGGLPGVLGQTYLASTVTALPTSLGVQFDTSMPIGGVLLAPFLRVAWVHNFGSQSTTTTIDSIGNVNSLVGAASPTNSALVDVGATLALGQHVALFAKFTDQYASLLESYAGTGGLRVTW